MLIGERLYFIHGVAPEQSSFTARAAVSSPIGDRLGHPHGRRRPRTAALSPAAAQLPRRAAVTSSTAQLATSVAGAVRRRHAAAALVLAAGPSPRRAVLVAVISGVIGPLTNLWGSGSCSSRSTPSFRARKNWTPSTPSATLASPTAGHLDYAPGFKRYVDDAKRFEFRFPATYVLDQAVYLRNADAAYNRRMMDPQGVMSGGRRARRRRAARRWRSGRRTASATRTCRWSSRRSSPASRCAASSAPEEGARRLLEGTINRQAVVEDTTLFSASERPNTRRGGEPLYQFEYRVDYEDERQPPSFTVCVVAADVRANQLYTFASRVPAKVWESGRPTICARPRGALSSSDFDSIFLHFCLGGAASSPARVRAQRVRASRVQFGAACRRRTCAGARTTRREIAGALDQRRRQRPTEFGGVRPFLAQVLRRRALPAAEACAVGEHPRFVVRLVARRRLPAAIVEQVSAAATHASIR